MVHLVVLPKLGLTMETGNVQEWLKREGEPVSAGEMLLVVESDKSAVEVEAHASGILRRVLVEPGVTVPVGTPIGIIADADADISGLDSATVGDDGSQDNEGAAAATAGHGGANTVAEPPSDPAQATSAVPQGRLFASPLAKRLAREHGLDLAGITGTGSHGRIRRRDVVDALEQGQASAMSGGPLRGLRLATAQAVARSKATVPHFYASREVDVAMLLQLRQAVNEIGTAEGHRHVPLTAIFAKLTAEVLRRHPALNVRFDGTRLEAQTSVDLAVAVGLDDGVVAPVIRNAERMSLHDIAAAIADMAEQARRRRLPPDVVDGGGFTLSNLGMFGLDAFIPIINAPQAATLAVGRITDRPAVRHGAVVVSPCAWLTLSADHRVIDGLQAASFLEELDWLCRNPLRIFRDLR